MFRRVETAFPVEQKKIQKRVKAELELYLADNSQAWVLQPDGGYLRLRPSTEQSQISAQQQLLEASVVG